MRENPLLVCGTGNIYVTLEDLSEWLEVIKDSDNRDISKLLGSEKDRREGYSLLQATADSLPSEKLKSDKK